MTKFMILLSSLVALTAPAAWANGAGYDTEALATVAHAKPLIKQYLSDVGAEYNVDLSPDESSFRARVNYAWFWNWPSYAIVGGTKYDYACRPVEVRIPSQNAKAIFYVRQTYSSGPFPIVRRYRDAHYSLVRGCAVVNLSLPPEFNLHPRPARMFSDAEFADAARGIVTKINADATDFVIETPHHGPVWDSVEPQDRSALEPDHECRHVSFTTPGQLKPTKVGITVFYDRSRPLAFLPREHQTVVKDQKSLRKFLFGLIKGCYGLANRDVANIAGDPK